MSNWPNAPCIIDSFMRYNGMKTTSICSPAFDPRDYRIVAEVE
jgi:hypothetical protein